MKVLGTGAPRMLTVRFKSCEIDVLRDELHHRRAAITETAAHAHASSDAPGAGAGDREVEDCHVELLLISRLLDELGVPVVPASVRGSRIDMDDAVPGDALRASLDALGLEAGASLLVPLVFRGQSLGVLAAFGRRDEAGRFDAEEERLLMAFAASAATAVATAHSVEAQRLRHSLAAAEAERARWAHELHDETLQGLGGLRMLVSAARRREDLETMRTAMEQVVEQIDGEIEGLRGLIRELRPAALDELSAAPAIEELGIRMASLHGIEVLTAVALEGRHLPEVETALYRIIQEALTMPSSTPGRLTSRSRWTSPTARSISP